MVMLANQHAKESNPPKIIKGILTFTVTRGSINIDAKKTTPISRSNSEIDSGFLSRMRFSMQKKQLLGKQCREEIVQVSQLYSELRECNTDRIKKILYHSCNETIISLQ